MKASDKPQFSTKWWDTHRPAELRATPLDKALSKVESALAQQRKKKDDLDAIDDCLLALEGVAAAADKTIKQCDKKKHKDLIAVLQKFDDLVDDETSRLEALQEKLDEQDSEPEEEDEDEESDEGKLFDRGYLTKMLKRLKSGGREMKFAFGLATSAPESSRLLLKRKGKPESLFKALKRTGQFSDRLMTYGIAQADPDDGRTLLFRIASGAGEPPQIEKLGRKFLCSDKSLKFRRLKLVLPGGRASAQSASNNQGQSDGGPP